MIQEIGLHLIRKHHWTLNRFALIKNNSKTENKWKILIWP